MIVFCVQNVVENSKNFIINSSKSINKYNYVEEISKEHCERIFGRMREFIAEEASVILEDTWSGKIFARSEDCQYKKCNSPYTVAELNFGGDSKEDKYRVSVANGYNKPIKIQPTGLNSFCKISTCNFKLKENCPKTHQVTSEDNDNIVSCKAIPEVFEKLCPQATELFSCKTSNTYFVAIG
ncbi:uncharacterized protein LOC130449105 isoform X2 [Diorhabda sublineata]|uniref:uncharacterized protein LOC130449105 isoform X2 n=1 Tax=Diorhabda sublineata TaxID=1163346 RepID=UPI0024E13696|nr:uncharacterized protein LOC130449105 isoform X2 [Diorhabda sublineata]